MKTQYLWSVIILISLNSCTMEDSITDNASQLPSDDHHKNFRVDEVPYNPDNIYDSAGVNYSKLTDAYLWKQQDSLSLGGIISIVNSVSSIDPAFIALKPGNYTAPNPTRMSQLTSDNQAAITDVISNSLLSWKAKVSIANYISTVIVLLDHPTSYEELHAFSHAFEHSIINDPTFTADDKRIILVTASITRHGYHYATRPKRKPRDREWRLSVGNIIAGMDGANESIAKAVSMSVVAGIEANQ